MNSLIMLTPVNLMAVQFVNILFKSTLLVAIVLSGCNIIIAQLIDINIVIAFSKLVHEWFLLFFDNFLAFFRLLGLVRLSLRFIVRLGIRFLICLLISNGLDPGDMSGPNALLKFLHFFSNASEHFLQLFGKFCELKCFVIFG